MKVNYVYLKFEDVLICDYIREIRVSVKFNNEFILSILKILLIYLF